MHINEVFNRTRAALKGGVVTLKTPVQERGSVLLSYFTHPFLAHDGRSLTAHTNYAEAWMIVDILHSRGFSVDVVDAAKHTFIPRKPYAMVIDTDGNLERYAKYVPSHCKKVAYALTSHWLVNNTAELARLHDFSVRRGATLPPERLLTPSRSEEIADYFLYFGNARTLSGYTPGIKTKVCNIPASSVTTHAPVERDDASRLGFVWIGGAGPIHKGLDLLIDALYQLPTFRLELCGKHTEKAFEDHYRTELGAPSFVRHGVIDLQSKKFEQIRARNAFLVSPSCAEGQSGAVISGMHAGLIPIVSDACGIDTHDFGITLPDCSLDTIKKTLVACSSMPEVERKERSIKAARYAQTHHTKETFKIAFENSISTALSTQ
jgi:glycosyltransferase involved in cell wall biosynthesis